jgi:hypothetical protein
MEALFLPVLWFFSVLFQWIFFPVPIITPL